MRRSRSVCIFGFFVTLVTVSSVLTFMIFLAAIRKPYSSEEPPQTDIVRRGNSANDEEGASRTLGDHRSHSKPGTHYEAVDILGQGEVKVSLSGVRSHTHYFDEGPPVVVGKLVSYLWFDNATHEILGSTVETNVSFPVGSHTIGLTVADNTRDTHTAYTTVVIKTSEFNGTYTYFYKPQNLGLDITKGARPDLAVHRSGVDFKSAADFPEHLRDKTFTARVVFLSELADGPVRLDHEGPVKFIVNDAQISGDRTSTGTEFKYSGKAGKHSCQIIYTNTGPGRARLVATSGLPSLLYDYAKVLPVVTSIDPDSSTFDGLGRAVIRGSGLNTQVKVYFGDVKAKVEPTDDDTQLTVIVPSWKQFQKKGELLKVVDVVVENKNGKSNTVPFQYNDEHGEVPVKFREVRVDFGSFPKNIWMDRLTGIKYGPDHHFYATSLKSRVIRFQLNDQMKLVGEPCESDSLGEHRQLMGLAFNYANTRTRLYVSSSILYWKNRNYLTGKDAWTNGKIHVLERTPGCSCICELKISPIITGLPVSNYDHGVNGLVFDDNGALRIQVGGFTNAGQIQDSKLGGVDENPLSASSLIARVEDANFNGRIRYRPLTPSYARQVSGDVEVYMAGLRNSFGVNVHSNGLVYATDNGPSRGFGAKSVNCKDSVDFLPADERHNVDKLVLLRRKMYAGHPNRNRGRTNPNECRFYRTIAKPDPKAKYAPPLALLPSSTDGIVEYVANSFRGALKGELILSMFSSEKPGSTMRVKLTKNGTEVEGGKPQTLIEGRSGLALELTPGGGLIFVQVHKKEIIAFLPVHPPVGIKPVFTSVMPNRGPTAGGNWVKVSGMNFGSSPSALFGTNKCSNVKDAGKTSFMCLVPPGTRGQTVSIRVKSVNNGSPRESRESEGVDYKYIG